MPKFCDWLQVLKYQNYLHIKSGIRILEHARWTQFMVWLYGDITAKYMSDQNFGYIIQAAPR